MQEWLGRRRSGLSGMTMLDDLEERMVIIDKERQR